MELNINKGTDQVQLPKAKIFGHAKFLGAFLLENIPKETVSLPEEAVWLSSWEQFDSGN